MSSKLLIRIRAYKEFFLYAVREKRGVWITSLDVFYYTSYNVGKAMYLDI
ncbi:MAG: hypothetical protein HYZ69_01870 [Candidatus Colwellbacteria bacterium]|nr:hypothetical protein [Candidatus Colwellbacteria bacterium]